MNFEEAVKIVAIAYQNDRSMSEVASEYFYDTSRNTQRTAWRARAYFRDSRNEYYR